MECCETRCLCVDQGMAQAQSSNNASCLPYTCIGNTTCNIYLVPMLLLVALLPAQCLRSIV